MKSLFPTSTKSVEQIRLQDDTVCDVYTWTSPEGIKIATHMIMPCPECSYPLSLASSEFDFDSLTLLHELKCPARWKKVESQKVGKQTLRLVQLNEKGKPIIQRCGWKGVIVKGKIEQL